MKYPLFKVFVDVDEAVKNVKSTLQSGYINEGVEVSLFKKEICSAFNSKNVVLTNSCTSALTMALKLSGVDSGSEVISTAMTCVATNTPIKNLGAKVVWADIDRNTGNISPESVILKITEKTKAVMCVNWAGLPCDLKKLHKICKSKNIKLIQDAAHAFGALYDNKSIVCNADFTCFSFQAIKHITSGDGGALVCLDENHYNAAEKMKWFGLDRSATKDEKGEWKGQRWESDIYSAGFKFNMNNISAAIGLSSIKHADKIIDKHRNNGALYNALFKESSLVRPLLYPADSNPSFWVYTVLLSEKVNRDKILEKLNDVGINAGLVHVPNHKYTCFKESYEKLIETEYFSEHQISLPCGWWLSSGDISHIANCLILECEGYS